MKTAIILFNLGGPDNPQAVKPFLKNLFNDPAIIRLPTPLRQILAHFIAAKRAPIAAAIYQKIGGRSPILENTKAQAEALEKELSDLGDIRCFVCMRYWHPWASEVAPGVKDFAPDRILLLPLYPQFSTTTTASSLQSWHTAIKAIGLDVPTKSIDYYPDEPGFIKTLADATRKIYAEAKKFGPARILFSAHGLPETIIAAGDPYQYQCEQTVAALVAALGIDDLDWVLCYQSRVGPLRWIGPATESEIEQAGREHLPVIIVPVSFVSENSETLYEIDILFRDLAAQNKAPYFGRVAAVGIAPDFIKGLASLARWALAEWQDIANDNV